MLKEKEEAKKRHDAKSKKAKELKVRINRHKLEIAKTSVKKEDKWSSEKRIPLFGRQKSTFNAQPKSWRKWDTSSVINIKIQGTPEKDDRGAFQRRADKRRNTLSP